MTQNRDVVVVGASAGGVEALRALVAGLPADYPGAVLIVLHIPRAGPSVLANILTRTGPLVAEAAVDGEELRYGRIYVAPNDRHLLLLGNRLRVSRGPSENGHRPAIDPLFRSAARAFGRRTVGVVLSGTRDDGAAGLASIVARGGTAVVQDPADALFSGMPMAALRQAPTEHVAPAAKLGGLIADITARDLPDDPDFPPGQDPTLDAEVKMSELGPVTTDELPVAPAGYGCPSCGGGLFQIGPSLVPRYRCRVGHAWSAESLLDEQALALESALWMALRALEEKSDLSQRLAVTQGRRESPSGLRFSEMAVDAASAGETIRRLIAELGSTVTPEAGPTGFTEGNGSD